MIDGSDTQVRLTRSASDSVQLSFGLEIQRVVYFACISWNFWFCSVLSAHATPVVGRGDGRYSSPSCLLLEPEEGATTCASWLILVLAFLSNPPPHVPHPSAQHIPVLSTPGMPLLHLSASSMNEGGHPEQGLASKSICVFQRNGHNILRWRTQGSCVCRSDSVLFDEFVPERRQSPDFARPRGTSSETKPRAGIERFVIPRAWKCNPPLVPRDELNILQNMNKWP